ncbi:hypothetical protein AAFF_G00302710 [Aldrovandia affinis]|uniref:Uncharacterized protein n=1 Tax=Aldrovandia affinis TaxID=143900 RepID=A0AAD7R866_9TELE|nr:hypothetical protein AAFF_G00302710 [Aldrovandia affinis]
MNFPKSLMAKLMLSELQAFSHKRTPTQMREVVSIVHHSDSGVLLRVQRSDTETQRTQKPRASQSQQAKSHTGQSQDSDTVLSQHTSFLRGVSRDRGHGGGDVFPDGLSALRETAQVVAVAKQALMDLIVREQTE